MIEKYFPKSIGNNNQIKMNRNKDVLKLKTIIIGSGTAIPVINHSPASIFLQSKDLTALLDLGPGTFSKLPIYDIDPLQINYIFISHLHPDHILDLAIYFMIRDYADKKKNISVNLIGCSGIKKFISQLRMLFPDISFPNDFFNIREMIDNEFNIGDVRVRTTSSNHTHSSIAFRFDINGKSLIYTSDCVYSKRLEEFCTEVDVLISECSFPDKWSTNDHMNAQKLGVMAENAHVKNLFITHCYPQTLKKNLEKQIKKYYSGSIHIAQDGDHING